MVSGSSELPQEGVGGREAPLDLHEGISTPGGCKRWPEHLRLVSSDGLLVRGRCRSTNLCDYCARLAAVENSELLALDALAGDAPQVWAVLTTRSTSIRPADFYESRRKLQLALERRWPACRYAALVEFTTGYGPRSGGRRRPHWNLLLKGIPTAAADQVHELVGKVWCPRTDSRPDAQFVGAIAEVGGLMRYLALHFQKESQRPPRGWRGHRFLKSRDYLNVSTPEARLRARESLRFKRYVYDALQAGLPSALAEAWAEACQEDARATTWKAVQLHQLAGKEWIRPVVGRKAA